MPYKQTILTKDIEGGYLTLVAYVKTPVPLGTVSVLRGDTWEDGWLITDNSGPEQPDNSKFVGWHQDVKKAKKK